MKNQPKVTKHTFPFYPLLFAIFPALAVFSVNIDQVEIGVLVRPLLASLLVAAFLFFIFHLVFKQWEKSAFYLFFILVLVSTYGWVLLFIRSLEVGEPVIGRHLYLIPFYLLIFGVGSWFILRKKEFKPALTNTLNVITIILIWIPLVQAASFYITLANLSKKITAQATSQANLVLPKDPPDVYYFILDMYTRQDAMLNDFEIDNSGFIDDLKQMGFYIADCGRSNYDYSLKSLSSSLNMDYLQQLSQEIKFTERDTTWMTSLVSKNRVRVLLREAGYRDVAFETGYDWDSWKDADVYLKPGFGSLLFRQLTPFEAMLAKTSALIVATNEDSNGLDANLESINTPFSEQIVREEFILDQLKNIATLPGPKFVFAHIVVTHDPFLFKADGSIQTDRSLYFKFPEGYRNQVIFLDSQMTTIVQSIIAQSKTPPIIILQGDHGAEGINRPEILNAYYLPGGESQLYPTITPVNTFRVIFNQYFGTKYPLLPDLSYVTNLKPPFNFILTPERSPACLP